MKKTQSKGVSMKHKNYEKELSKIESDIYKSRKRLKRHDELYIYLIYIIKDADKINAITQQKSIDNFSIPPSKKHDERFHYWFNYDRYLYLLKMYLSGKDPDKF